MIVDYIDGHRDEFGVEPICRVLTEHGCQIAPSTYYARKRRPPSARAVRDVAMMQVLMVLWVANRKVYGAHKLWKAARRAGHDIGRDQVARLMRELDIRGVSRRRKVFTTIADPDATRAPDLVDRNFCADRPDALWVTDLTYVPTRSGMAYVCFIVDAFSRRIVGWRVASHMRTDMVLEALEMARRSRGSTRLVGLVTHSDAGSQPGSSPRCASPSASTRSALVPRSEPSPTPTTTPWQKQRTGSTRPSASTDPTPPAGMTSTSSNWKPSPGCTGSTPTASTATAATSRPQSSRQPTTLPNRPPQPGMETNNPSLHQTQGGSVGLPDGR